MLSYQHSYHAGNFADVLKHTTLSCLLEYLTLKEKPLFYLDTHSGRGLYNLQDDHTHKTGEANNGIELIWKIREKLPTVFLPYLQKIQEINPNGQLQYYPGSPHFAIQTLRKIDRLFFFELHPQEFSHLNKIPKENKRVFYHHDDGLANLKALLPPSERRGLIFIDPSYEIKTDYDTMPLLLKSAYTRFATGVYCLWYPILKDQRHKKMLNRIKNINAKTNLLAEFQLNPTLKSGMTGCGLWIINPPYTLADQLNQILKTLCSIFSENGATYLLETDTQ